MDRGFTPEEVHELTQIDLWFLYKIEDIAKIKQDEKSKSKIYARLS